MKLCEMLLVVGLLGFGVVQMGSGQAVGKVHAKRTHIVYACSMHPDVTSSKPGKCPRCGMKLERKPAHKQTQIYVCPMHPEVTSTKPGECPKCAMDLDRK